MSLSDREWTIFAIDAECDTFGHRRIVAEYNRQRAENAKLREVIVALQNIVTFDIAAEAEEG